MQVRHKAHIAYYSKSRLMKVLCRDLLDSVMSHIKVKQYFCKAQLWFQPVQLFSPWCLLWVSHFWTHVVYKQLLLVFLSFINKHHPVVPEPVRQSVGSCCRAYFQAGHPWASLLGLHTCPDPSPHKVVRCPEGLTVPFGPPAVCDKETFIVPRHAAAFGAMALHPLCTLLWVRGGAAATGWLCSLQAEHSQESEFAARRKTP